MSTDDAPFMSRRCVLGGLSAATGLAFVRRSHAERFVSTAPLKPGEFVWSRVFVANGRLCADLGRAKAIELPQAETERRWSITNASAKPSLVNQISCGVRLVLRK